MIVHNPSNVDPIHRVFVFVSRDADGKEGICGAPIPGLGMQPMIASTPKTLEIMKELAKYVEMRIPDKTIHLLEFSTRREVEGWR